MTIQRRPRAAYLARLADRAVGRGGDLRPRLPGRFEFSIQPDAPRADPAPERDPPLAESPVPPGPAASAGPRAARRGAMVQRGEEVGSGPEAARTAPPVERGRATPAHPPAPPGVVDPRAEAPPPPTEPAAPTRRAPVPTPSGSGAGRSADGYVAERTAVTIAGGLDGSLAGDPAEDLDGDIAPDRGVPDAAPPPSPPRPPRRVGDVETALGDSGDGGDGGVPAAPAPVIRTRVPDPQTPTAADGFDRDERAPARDIGPGWTTGVTRPRRRASAEAATGPDEPAITVSIGRVEVRAPAPEPRQPARHGYERPRAAATAPKLADYLRAQRDRQ